MGQRLVGPVSGTRIEVTVTTEVAPGTAPAGPTGPGTGGTGGGEERNPLRSAAAIGSRVLEFPAISAIIATAVLVIVIGSIHPTFLQAGQIADVLQSSIYTGLLAVGLAYLIAMRDIDLSVGSTFALCLIVGAILMRDGWNPWIAALVCIALGAALGFGNALIVSWIRIPTIITTLATLSAYRGLATAASNGEQVSGLPTGNSFFTVLGGQIGDVPIGVLITIGIMIPVALVLHHTPFGYRVLAIGSNPEAAEFSGISVNRVRTQVLVLIGLLSGISAVLGLAYFTSGDPTIGGDFALEAIAAAVIGGTPLRGGRASILGAFVGAILLNVVTSGLTYFGIPANWSEFATGVVIIVAVGFDSLVRYRQIRSAAGISA